MVLSKGIWERLQVCPETLALFVDNDIDFHMLGTKEAVVRYNHLRDTVPVGGLIHSTC